MKFFIIFCLTCALAIPYSLAQTPGWSDEQTDAWNYIEQSWEDAQAENGKWPKNYLHENALAWGPSKIHPQSRDQILKWQRYSDEQRDIVMYELYPLAIAVAGDTAVVNYALQVVGENAQQERGTSYEGVIDVLTKVEGEWKFLSTNGFELTGSAH